LTSIAFAEDHGTNLMRLTGRRAVLVYVLSRRGQTAWQVQGDICPFLLGVTLSLTTDWQATVAKLNLTRDVLSTCQVLGTSITVDCRGVV